MSKIAQTEALYSIVKEKIKEMIKSGKYKSGEKLPTEAEFCYIFNVSRTTVRIALQHLEFEGRILRVQGKGTYVAKEKIQQHLTSTTKGFAQQMASQGLKANIKVIDLKVIPATETLASAFEIKVGDPLNKLVRIRYADEEPLQYEVAYIPWSIAPGLREKECAESLYRVLRDKYKIQFSKTVEAVEPILSDENIGKHLNVKIGAPCLSIETTAFSSDQVPFEYSFAVFRGDRSTFIIEREYTN